jgi:cellulose synthase/poly-beta-1,6-N-acetylglucosamine synthase-like glycosyltransferase
VGEALRSLAAQTRIPDEVIVIDDRCSDLRAAIALDHEATVMSTFENLDKKAGALNQILGLILPRLTDNDAVMTMDADSSISSEFISEAALRLREPEGTGARVGGVGAVFLGHPVRWAVGHLQQNEYVRYAREIGRRHGRADVLTGTATLFSVRALRDVQRARIAGGLPEGTGVYSTQALTEDNELTLALKHLGYRCVSPKECTVGTEVMPTTERLLHQRLRWQRGAIENLRQYGVTRHTVPYILRQFTTYVVVALLPFFLATLAYTVATKRSVPWAWFWVFATGFVIAERVWSVRRGGWRAVGLAALVVPEIIYDVVLRCVYIKALTYSVFNAHETWDRASMTRAERERPWWRGGAGILFTVALFAAAVGLAVVCSALGVAWSIISYLVLAGVAAAALRLSGLDPMALVLRSGELARVDPAASRPPQGFGGLDVPEDGSEPKPDRAPLSPGSGQIRL